MALGIGIPYEFSRDGRGMSAQGFFDMGSRAPSSPGLPDIKPFVIADTFVVFHERSSSSEMNGDVASSYPRDTPRKIALIV